MHQWSTEFLRFFQSIVQHDVRPFGCMGYLKPLGETRAVIRIAVIQLWLSSLQLQQFLQQSPRSVDFLSNCGQRPGDYYRDQDRNTLRESIGGE